MQDFEQTFFTCPRVLPPQPAVGRGHLLPPALSPVPSHVFLPPLFSTLCRHCIILVHFEGNVIETKTKKHQIIFVHQTALLCIRKSSVGLLQLPYFMLLASENWRKGKKHFFCHESGGRGGRRMRPDDRLWSMFRVSFSSVI